MKKTLITATLTILSIAVFAQDYDLKAMEESSDAIEEILPDVRWETQSAEILQKGKYSGELISGVDKLKEKKLYRIYQFNSDGTMAAEFETWGNFTSWMQTDGAEIEINGETINDSAYAYFWEYSVDVVVMVLTQYGKDIRLKFTLVPMN